FILAFSLSCVWFYPFEYLYTRAIDLLYVGRDVACNRRHLLATTSKEITMEPTKDKRVSDHLANERTFLAWIRTSIGIMAFGFVVVRFSLFVKQLTLILNKDSQV